MNLSNIKTTSVKVQRVIEASPSEVFDAWLDPDCQGSPWNGVAKAILQPVTDGLFYRMHLSEKGDYELAHYGRFIVVEHPAECGTPGSLSTRAGWNRWSPSTSKAE